MTAYSRALEDVVFVAEHWADLSESRIPGTARPWQPPQVTAERREQLEHKARIERLERAEIAPGERPIPVHPDVLDVMIAVSEAAGRLAPQLAVDADCSLLMPTVAAHLAHLELHLRHDGYDLDLVEQIATEFRRLAQAVALALRLLRDGQTLDCACPWCRMPRALVVREESTLGPLIVCSSQVSCEPPEADCGARLRGRPAWPQYEWDWLAKRIRHADRLGHMGRLVPDSAREATAARLAHEAAARELWSSYNTPESVA